MLRHLFQSLSSYTYVVKENSTTIVTTVVAVSGSVITRKSVKFALEIAVVDTATVLGECFGVLGVHWSMFPGFRTQNKQLIHLFWQFIGKNVIRYESKLCILTSE